MKLIETTFKQEDAIILLQDLTGKVPMLSDKEREILTQTGEAHYSEMLPIEKDLPSEYMKIFEDILKAESAKTAAMALSMCKQIAETHKNKVTLVSITRAGTPIGVIAKRILESWGLNTIHYSISAIKGKGLDSEALKLILEKHPADSIQLIDGWIGKGAISNEIEKSIKVISSNLNIEKMNTKLAVLCDPCNIAGIAGSKEDALIPSACLNAGACGLMSRSVKLKNMSDNELHGAVNLAENGIQDRTYEIINSILNAIPEGEKLIPTLLQQSNKNDAIQDLNKAAEMLEGKPDFSRLKPGIGETTRSLLRRAPSAIIVNNNVPKSRFTHIMKLCKDKKVDFIEVNFLKAYTCIGLVKDFS